jgi:uncharacterized membrane protein YbaN (DUF454 family)
MTPEINQFKRILLLCSGFLFVFLGLLGAVLPVMPSVPFFIIASVCFSKSSRKFHDMLMNNKLIGPHIKRYHENNGIELKTKILLILLHWVGILGSSILFVHGSWGRILMVAIGVAATLYLLSLKTIRK